MNKDEHYEVIDECMEKKTPEAPENTGAEDAEKACPKSDSTTQQQDPKTNTDSTSSHNNDDKPVPMEVECDQGLNNDTTDFTVDISLDQLDTQKEVTDEDVMHHLDVIENIELDPETFGIDQSMKEVTPSSAIEKEEQDKEEITVIDDEPSEQKWYENKIAEKGALLKERLSKLARVLSVSYSHYEKWLERIEKVEGSPICKIDPPRRCSLIKPHTNRWKFLCSKKHVQIPIKEENNPSSSNKKCFKVEWCLEPMGAGGVNTDNLAEFPAFVLNAVKIFEDFLQTTISSEDAITFNENPDDISVDDSKKDPIQDKKQVWSWLLVRCNSKDELMLFATGKNINRNTMDRLRHIYESGLGKNCNVKSLYCKSINKYDDKAVTTFLVGAEALDEVVGNLQLQLTPKTNFWSNAAGAWNVAKTVADMLKPTPKTTILEVGCGIGIIGLTIAPKCREVIGIDSPSEIEEAKMTCNLNKIYNVSFIMGSPFEVVNKINAARDLHNKNRVTYCIVNTNTNMGRAIEVMTSLRKITSLRRIVMVTALTKQSVRAILELARPIENDLGNPFMPIRACVVDTLPNGPHFDAVILMERRCMHRLTQPWFLKMLERESKSLDNTRELERIINNDGTESSDVLRKNPLAKAELAKKSKLLLTKKTTFTKSGSSSPVKSKIKLKRDHSPEIIEISKKVSKKFEEPGFKSWQQDVTAKKKNWFHENSALRINPLFEKKTKENKEQVDLRKKLSSNRIDADLIQKVNESRQILEAAKEKLSGPSPTVDATTAKELKNVLSLVLDQTNKLQNQLPRSVWDRIAPPETDQIKKDLDDDPLLKGRFVQETRAQDIVITAANKEYLETGDVKPKFKKYHNLAPLEPDTVMPVSAKSSDNRSRQQNQDNSWNRNKNFDKNRWNNVESVRKPTSPMKRQDLSFRHRTSPSNRFSPKRPLLSPPRRLCSPPRRHLPLDRPYETHDSPPHREYSLPRRPASPLRHMASSSGGRLQITPPRRPFSPLNRAMSPPRRPMSPPRRSMTGRPISPIRCHISPPRLQLSPPRREISPIGIYDSSARQISPMRRQISPMRRPMSPMDHQMSTDRRPVSPVGRMMSPSRSRDMIPPPRHHSPGMRRFSPHRMPSGMSSPPRRQQSPPRRQSPPPNRFADEWDIPSRGAIEQSSTWQRFVNDRPENVWRNERQSTTSGNWQALSDNDRYCKSVNQEKSWDARDVSFHGNSWGSKQSLAKPGAKEPWQTSDNRWPGPSRSGAGGENWGRGKESWMNMDKSRSSWEQSNDSWNQGDKDDWNDLPEDARDPWGDDGNLGLKERWMNLDNQPSSSAWSREADKGDPWTKSKDSWQNKSQAFAAKQPCQNSGPSMNESRWKPLNDATKKVPLSTNWQGSNNAPAWQSSNYNFPSQSQRPFMTNPFKDRR
ncbi:tRNA (uracil(54)-C(5))-methyltransferase [Camponotus japonicus]